MKLLAPSGNCSGDFADWALPGYPGSGGINM